MRSMDTIRSQTRKNEFEAVMKFKTADQFTALDTVIIPYVQNFGSLDEPLTVKVKDGVCCFWEMDDPEPLWYFRLEKYGEKPLEKIFRHFLALMLSELPDGQYVWEILDEIPSPEDDQTGKRFPTIAFKKPEDFSALDTLTRNYLDEEMNLTGICRILYQPMNFRICEGFYVWMERPEDANAGPEAERFHEKKYPDFNTMMTAKDWEGKALCEILEHLHWKNYELW